MIGPWTLDLLKPGLEFEALDMGFSAVSSEHKSPSAQFQGPAV